MKFHPPLRPAVFLSRENRFRALVECEGRTVPAHVPNSGRMSELLLPGRRARVALIESPGRKTACDLVLIEHEGRWVSVDSRLPPRLVQEALATGVLSLARFPTVLRREVARAGSRFDLAATDGDTLFVVEAKSVNLVVDGQALFPDAPTGRGARHCRHLAELAAQGGQGAIVFVIQREDAGRFSPHVAVDPEFASALASARDAGVLVRALRCRVTETEITPAGEVPVELTSPSDPLTLC